MNGIEEQAAMPIYALSSFNVQGIYLHICFVLNRFYSQLHIHGIEEQAAMPIHALSSFIVQGIYLHI